ncbi:MAG: aconitase X catalytic domain-containing protein [Archaeoglobaceae archaeon]
MYLTKEEERLLESENETIATAMKLLVTVGKMFDAERLVKVKSAHVSGVSYDNIGDAGLEWLESLNAKVSVPTTLNPAGFDVKRWREMGIGEEFYEKQMRIIKAFERLGVKITLTCTPYYIHKPAFGDHLAWAESSAVVYANSLIGARTNREAAITALAAAIVGRTPFFGLHVKENRAPTVRLKVSGDLAAAGYEAGKLIGGEIPYVIFDRKPSEWELKLFGAALAATGSVPMFHSPGITPEAEEFEVPSESVEVEGRGALDCDPDLIAVGCPHASEEELKMIYELLKGEKVKREFWVFTSRSVASKAAQVVEKLESLGVKVFSDTCMVVSPATDTFECVVVNSGKALHYVPERRRCEVGFADIFTCVKLARTP